MLGRHGEPGGAWSGRLVADVGGRPLLRQTQTSAVLAAGPPASGSAAVRSIVSRLLLGPDVPAATAATSGEAVVCPLAAGGVLLTCHGADLATALRHLEDVWPATPVTGALHGP